MNWTIRTQLDLVCPSPTGKVEWNQAKPKQPHDSHFLFNKRTSGVSAPQEPRPPEPETPVLGPFSLGPLEQGSEIEACDPVRVRKGPMNLTDYPVQAQPSAGDH